MSISHFDGQPSCTSTDNKTVRAEGAQGLDGAEGAEEAMLCGIRGLGFPPENLISHKT